MKKLILLALMLPIVAMAQSPINAIKKLIYLDTYEGMTDAQERCSLDYFYRNGNLVFELAIPRYKFFTVTKYAKYRANDRLVEVFSPVVHTSENESVERSLLIERVQDNPSKFDITLKRNYCHNENCWTSSEVCHLF